MTDKQDTILKVLRCKRQMRDLTDGMIAMSLANNKTCVTVLRFSRENVAAELSGLERQMKVMGWTYE